MGFQKMSCCQRFCFEFQRPMFEVEEHPKGTLDIRESFHVGKGLVSCPGTWKLLSLAIGVASVTHAFLSFPHPSFYVAFLTAWGGIFCILYLGASFFLTMSSNLDHTNHFERTTPLVKITWILFSVAAVLECVVVAMYWIFVYEPEHDLDLSNFLMHGGVALIVWFQGLLVDRVPVRIKHMSATFLISCLYTAWLAIQNLVTKYNPSQDDDDDALYDVVKWRENTTGAIIMVTIVLFGAVPLFTILLWAISLPGRKYLEILGGNADDGVITKSSEFDMASEILDGNADDAFAKSSEGVVASIDC